MGADNAYPAEIIKDFEEMGVVVHTKLAETSYMSERGQIIEKLGGYAVLTSSVSYVTTKQQFMKRGLDILGGFVGSLITLLLCMFIGPAIYFKSPGPIFLPRKGWVKMGSVLKCTSSVPCIWMRRSVSRN